MSLPGQWILDLANIITNLHVKFLHIYFVVNTVIRLDAKNFYNIIYLFIYLFIHLFVNLFRYIHNFFIFYLSIFFDLIISFLYVDMCMCESNHSWRLPCGGG